MAATCRPSSAAVGYGIGGKVSVQIVASRSGTTTGRTAPCVTERAWGELWETTERQPGDGGVLTALLSSHDGAALASLPDAAARVDREIERIFPGVKGLAGERVQHRLDQRPVQPRLLRHVRSRAADAPPGRCCGAATVGCCSPASTPTRFAGYMEGALRSGARVAAEIRAGR